jgi:phenylpropionate dioxygenase-like ring-hydroxylating dioxygenase large terminal subunit
MSVSMEDLSSLSAGYDPVAARSWSLPARCYVEPGYLAHEREAIFKKSWQYVCHVERVREPGDYVTVDLHGQSLVVIRGKDGVLRCFYNVCLHRAHELLSGSGNTKQITCPYHAWVYRLDGSLRAARRSEFIENFDADEFCLTQVGVETFLNLVFVNLDPAAAPLATQTQGLADEVRSWAPDLDDLTHAHRIEYTIKSNWKSVVDNFLECYHCPVAHRDFVSLVNMDTYKVETYDIYSSHLASAGTRLDNTAYQVDGASVQDHAVWWLWPNICLLRYPGEGNMMVLNVVPIDHETTYETYDFYFLNPEPSKGQWEAIEYVDKVLQREDIDIVESVQRGMSTPAFDRGRFMVDPDGGGLSEHGVHHFHGLVLDALTRRAETA